MNKPCVQCGTMVPFVWNQQNNRMEPTSKYWKGLDISEVYCGAQCSLDKHEKDSGTHQGPISPITT